MRTWIILIATLSALGGGCAETDVEPTNEQESELGTLELSLRGIDERMQVYRLRNATFDVQGTRYTDYQYVTSTVSSDADLDSSTARTPLFYGSYSVALKPDTWYLERIDSSGNAEPVTEAVLLSSSAQQVFIQQGMASRVTFQFGVDGQPIDFFGGELEIGIEVRNAPEPEGESTDAP